MSKQGRSRTGCLTCRQRKLKCSEERPVCAQCAKSNRECIPSGGITFRHQQNPSLNGVERGEGSLKSFYGYKETFGKGTVWVDVPQELTFVHTSNPYEDEDDVAGGADTSYVDGDSSFLTDVSGRQRDEDHTQSIEYQLAQAAYPMYATHGLEALSAVATQDQYSYAPPPATMGQHEPTTPSTTSPQHNNMTPSSNLDYILNPAAAARAALSPSNIDPRLHAETPQSAVSAPEQQSQNPIPDHHVRTLSYNSSVSAGRPSLRAQGILRRRARHPPLADPKLAFLLRDFSERAGLWMDLFDLGLFFATTVPVLAVQCPLLLYSCVALSAKSLARVDGRKPTMGGQVSRERQSKMEKWPGPTMTREDWAHTAREYYDLAVSLLRQALEGANKISPNTSRPTSSSLPENTFPSAPAHLQSCPLPAADSDELVGATAILCVYEFLDASEAEWSRHLDGAKSLFDFDWMVGLARPTSPTASLAQQTSAWLASNTRILPARPMYSKSRKAVFWNFARQDMLSAFINNTSTRLDTSDLVMWRSAGLKLTAGGYVCPSDYMHPDWKFEDAMDDDMISNAFVWLCAKLVNFIAAGDDVPLECSPPANLGVKQKELLEYWNGLDSQFKYWYDGLPDNFTPTAQLLPQDEGEERGIKVKWFPRPMCASAMQWWHFARIQLLHNKPHLTTAGSWSPSRLNPLHPSALSTATPGTSLAARHASYTSILQESREHAKEIVAIGLGRSDEGTRIHSVQPLWTAGLVLGGSAEEVVDEETDMWRRSIINQLRGIERDMGWAAEYRVKSLLDIWGLPSHWTVDTPD